MLDSVQEKSEKKKGAWIPALLAYGIYLAGIDLRGEALAALELLLWGVIPLLWGLKKKLKKVEKSA